MNALATGQMRDLCLVGLARNPTQVTVRAATNRALRAISVPSDPSTVAMTPDGKTVYVVNNNGGP